MKSERLSRIRFVKEKENNNTWNFPPKSHIDSKLIAILQSFRRHCDSNPLKGVPAKFLKTYQTVSLCVNEIGDLDLIM